MGNDKQENMQSQEYERIKDLAVRHAQGLTDEAEERELQAWRESKPEREAMFRRMMSRQQLEENIRRFAKTPEEEEQAWQRILERTVRREKWLRVRQWTRVAAMFLLPIAAGILAWWALERGSQRTEIQTIAQTQPGKAGAILVLPQGEQVALGEKAVALAGGMQNRDYTLNYRTADETPEKEEVALHLLRIPRGGEYTLVLADSTVVHLNSETELRYPAHFGGKERKVYLRGEAYFDVMPNAEKPFIVEAGGMDVRVYGTEFNVTAYEGECVRTVLVEGKVGVKTAEGSEEVQLHPGQMAEREGNGIVVQEVDTYTYTAWKDGKFVFEEENIERIMERLARWYNLNVFYANESVKNQLFNGVLTRFTEVEDILRVIEQTATVEFEIKGNTVIVK